MIVLQLVLFCALFAAADLLMRRRRGPESGRFPAGGGDIKLFAVVGLYIGFLPSLFCVMIACITGLFAAVVLKSKSISFGPFIAVGAYFMILWGEDLKTLYLGLF